jgi:hypothetical protein
VEHLQRLLRAAIYERLGYTVGSDELIRMALDALMADVDTPALRQLAGLNRGEEPDAHDLFDQVVDELGLAPSLPDLFLARPTRSTSSPRPSSSSTGPGHPRAERTSRSTGRRRRNT